MENNNSNKKPVAAPSGPAMRGPGGPGMRGFGVPVQKPKNFKQTTRTLLKRLAPFRLAILFVLVAALGSTVFAIAGPKILGHATTEIFTGMIGKFTGGPGIDFTAIARILVLLILLYGISSILSFIQGYVMSTITQKVSYTLRKEISEKINRMPMKSLDAITHGEILSRVTNDIDTLSQNLNQGLVQVITSSATLVGVLVMMLSISWLMTLVTVVILPLSFIFISRIVKLSQKYFVQQQAALGQVNGQVEEVYGGHAVVKAFNGEAQVVETFNQTNEKLYLRLEI